MILIAALNLAAAPMRAQEVAPTLNLHELRQQGIAGRQVTCRGTVTCVETHHFFIQDSSDALQIQVWNAAMQVTAGDVVTVKGVLVGYGGGLQLRGEDLTKQGTAPLPAPETLTAESLVSGGSHCQRVKLSGVVHDVALVNDEVRLLVRSGTIPLTVCWHLREGELQRPDDLLDAIVEFVGVAHSGAAPNGAPSGGRIPLAVAADLHILKPGNRDVFTRPLRTLQSLREEPSVQPERFRSIGTVTYASPAGWFYFQDGTSTARGGKNVFLIVSPEDHRPIQENPALDPGDVVEVVGYIFQDLPGKAMPWLVQCEWRILRSVEPPPWEPVPSSTILQGDFDGRPVSVTGEVIDITVEKDREGYFNHMLTINDDGVSFWALLQEKTAVTLPVKTGDYIRLQGVAMAFRDTNGKTERFRVNLNELGDIQPTLAPMQARNLMRWLLGGLAAIFIAVVWIVALRLQVRRQTAALLESQKEQERFKAVSETSTDFIAIATLENFPLYMNPAGRAMLGIPQDADIGTIPFESISTPDGRELVNSVGLPHAFAHGHWQGELNMRHLDGREVPVSFLGLVIRSRDGKPEYIAAIARDISARRQMEEQLRQSNEELLRFRSVVDASTDHIGMAALDKTPLYVNPAGRSMLGIPLDLAPSETKFEDFFSPLALEQFEKEGFPHAMEHGYWHSEITMLHRHGHEIPVSFVGLIIKAPDGTPLYMSSIARDITKTRDLETKLRESLEQERQLNQLKSNFVNTISHEFRTPLGIVLFASSMLRRFDARFSSEERAAQLDTIDQAVERMNDLVEQSLSLGRAEVAKPHLVLLDARDFCQTLISEVVSTTSHRCRIELEAGDDLPQALSDDTMLRTVLTNLLGNAVKYSEAGTTVTLSIQRHGENATFTVRDRGPGLREEEIPKIFASFHRGADTADIPGTGLGLAIVKRCIESLGGSILGRNAEGGGAEFIVTLPNFFPQNDP
jgi:PAS domain S-box-containing protein